MTKKPYTKFLALFLLDAETLKEGISCIDLAKVARECLKSLSSEDLMQYGQSPAAQLLRKAEIQFTDINGFALENELAKIIFRYEKEGKQQTN